MEFYFHFISMCNQIQQKPQRVNYSLYAICSSDVRYREILTVSFLGSFRQNRQLIDVGYSKKGLTEQSLSNLYLKKKIKRSRNIFNPKMGHICMFMLYSWIIRSFHCSGVYISYYFFRPDYTKCMFLIYLLS